MADVNFDKAIAQFAMAHTAATEARDEALVNLAAGLERLSVALHQELGKVQERLQKLERGLAG
ncbi:MAG TPA: hypothetical protein VLV87_09935 [Gammaproteobacteria bacterium]|nr:hypothetical protein [Gammaproteobacteria bacterium]